MDTVLKKNDVTPENILCWVNNKYAFTRGDYDILMQKNGDVLYMIQHLLPGKMLSFSATYYWDFYSFIRPEKLDQFCSEACAVSTTLRIYQDYALDAMQMDFTLIYDETLRRNFFCNILDTFMEEVDGTLYLFREKFHLQ